MARSKRSRSSSRGRSADSSQAIRDSAQKILLAGLGAFERAKSEGPRVFESLVEQGREMGARAVGMADEALKTMREARSPGGWDKLEKAVENRVAQSLQRFGVMTRAEADALARQVRELNDNLEAFVRSSAGARPGGAEGRKAASRSKAGKARAKSKTRKAKSAAAPRANSARGTKRRAKAKR